jgi:hypothetical protein
MGNSPLKDAKFLTSLQPAATDPKRLIKMTPEERQESREGLANAVDLGLTIMPVGGMLYKGARAGVAAGVSIVRQGFKLPFMRNVIRNLAFQGAKTLGKKGAQKIVQKGTIGNYANIASAPPQEEKKKVGPPSDFYLP